MFGPFIHPRPVTRRREVPELVTAARQRAFDPHVIVIDAAAHGAGAVVVPPVASIATAEPPAGIASPENDDDGAAPAR